MDLTWQDIADYVTEYAQREGAQPNPRLYQILGNQALKIISEMAGPCDRTWSNAADGELVLVSNTVAMSSEIVSINSVFWNDIEIFSISSGELDTIDPGWRKAIGTPNYYVRNGRSLMLDRISADNVAGKLVIHGTGTLPAFGGLVNPIEYIPAAHQLAPAYFILSRLPVTPAQPVSDTNVAISAANQETQRRVQVREEHKLLWDTDMPLIIDAIHRRNLEPYTY